MTIRSFPISLLLEQRAVLVVGGGETAKRKAQLVSRFGCRITVIDPTPDSALIELAADVQHRRFKADDVDGHALVFAATDDEIENRMVAAAAQSRAVPINVPDRPEISSFMLPAIIDRDPIVVAISTGGAAPALARRLREEIEARLDPALGRLALFLDSFRSAVRVALRPDQRRRFWESVIDGPIASAVLRGNVFGARADLIRLLHEPERRVGSVALVGAGPGNPDLLTVRALRLLQDADVIIHDQLGTERVLDLARREARLINVGKRKGQHTATQDEINRLLVAEARAGNRVVRLKGGDPFVFGRGAEEIEALRTAGIAVEAVPGITAALGCGAATTIPVTHRELASGVTFVSGHGKEGAIETDWTALARLRHTLVIYMGLSATGQIAHKLLAAGMSGATPAALIENGTLSSQRLIVGTLAELEFLARESGMTGPTLIVIGDVVRHADPAQVESGLRAPVALREAV